MPDHLKRLHEELDRWAGWVRDGVGQDEFVARARRPAAHDATVHDATDVIAQSWVGLRRYWDKRGDDDVLTSPARLELAGFDTPNEGAQQ